MRFSSKAQSFSAVSSAVPRPWVVLWLLLALVGAGLSIWWAGDALWGDDCARFVARTDRAELALGLTVLFVPLGAWAATRAAPSLFRSNIGQGIYLAGAVVLLGTAVAVGSSMNLYDQPVIGWFLGSTAGCAV